MHILNGPPVPADAPNLLSWKRKYPRHHWALEKLRDSSAPAHHQLAVQLTESIKESGRLGEKTMNMLWETAAVFETQLRESVSGKSSGSS
jgi:hypothetical protein